MVELGLRLPGGKLLPIDSKWVSSGALEQLADPAIDAARRAQLTGQVEREVERRVREVSQYINPETTSPFALAVIPDAAYDVCRGAIVDAHKRHVMVVGYAMALPYLLTLYQLHLQFARTVDMEKMQSALIDVERHLDVLEGILENKLQRAVTMLQNAYGEGKQVSARIRASAQSIQVAETRRSSTRGFHRHLLARPRRPSSSRPVLHRYTQGLPSLCPIRCAGLSTGNPPTCRVWAYRDTKYVVFGA